jgi:hypothetical protein
LDSEFPIHSAEKAEWMGREGLCRTRPSRVFFDSVLNRLLVGVLVVLIVLVMVMVVVMMGMYFHHNLRLRRIGYCEAEEEHRCKQKLFHTL